mgnify:CR=1 FL=1
MTPGKKEKKCPKCDSSLHYVEQVGQHYCFSCEAYFEMVDAEEKQAEAEKKVAVKEKKEPQEAKPEEAKTEEKPEEKVSCPSCGETASFMEDARRYYCYSCEDYIDIKKPAEEEIEGGKEEKIETAAARVPEEKPSEVPAATPPEIPSTAPVEEKPAVGEQKAEPPEAIIEKELEKEEKRRSCQDCGSELIYVQKYDRWYCRKCRKYAPREGAAKGAMDARKCPKCGGEATFIEAYSRWYCYSCKEYLPTREAVSGAKRPERPTCQYCGKPLTWIEQYGRYYCYPCKKYAPKTEKEEPKKKPEGPICPDCGRQTTWIQTDERYYCYPCRKYVQLGGESKTIPERPKKSSLQLETAAPKCESCGKPTTWIAQYQRYYCYPCKKYAPSKSPKK